MPLLRKIAAGLRSLFRKDRTQRELESEVNDFLEMAAEEKMKQGMSRQEARRLVRIEHGNVSTTSEIVHSARWEFFVQTWCQDLRFATRVLRKNPGFTLAAVVTIALGDPSLSNNSEHSN